ncbi:TetR/AcrR family transcriptional regulator [Pseudonocardia spinosispora]|uniref:TetR/AcrR family transcriptional regulator n=1 Tax=Pseudonocardia spinosispora TaxID=103441 RepID=UPI000418FD37|nr:TetR/AcrR family transcriptional regulator [Pseudonocardia spinosispora]
MAGRRSARSLPNDAEAAQLSLLKTAEECFERYGVRRVTMDEIAAAAGVSRPTLYRYFGDRDSLIKSIVDHRAGKLVSKVHRLLDEQATLADKLIAGTLFLVDIGRNDQFIRELLRSDSDHFTNELMIEQGTATAFADAVWSPTLHKAASDGLLPEDFDERMAYRWLTSINFMLIGWQDYDDQPLSYKQEMLRRFLAPAFLRAGA